jgi:hypothetical protein
LLAARCHNSLLTSSKALSSDTSSLLRLLD